MSAVLGPNFYGASGPAAGIGTTQRGRGSWTAHRPARSQQAGFPHGPQHYVPTPSGLELKVTARPARRFRFIRGLLGIGVYTVSQIPRIVWREVYYRDGYVVVNVRLDLPGGLLVVVEQGAKPVAFKEVLVASLEHRLQVPLPQGTTGTLRVHLETVVV